MSWANKKTRKLMLNWFGKIPEIKGKIRKGKEDEEYKPKTKKQNVKNLKKGKDEKKQKKKIKRTWKVDHESLGLHEYGDRKNWKHEFALMVSGVYKKDGFYGALRNTLYHKNKARGILDYEEKRKLNLKERFFKKKRKKTLLKLGSKFAATSLRNRKVAQLQKFFPQISR